jgi:hypothetical protein
MPKKSVWESIRVESGELVAKVKQLVREGNVRRVVVKQGARTLAEFPLTVGVVGALAAPTLAALGALAALLTRCTIVVEREGRRATGAHRARRTGARSAKR